MPSCALSFSEIISDTLLSRVENLEFTISERIMALKQPCVETQRNLQKWSPHLEYFIARSYTCCRDSLLAFQLAVRKVLNQYNSLN